MNELSPKLHDGIEALRWIKTAIDFFRGVVSRGGEHSTAPAQIVQVDYTQQLIGLLGLALVAIIILSATNLAMAAARGRVA